MRNAVLLTIAFLVATMCDGTARADWVPLTTYDPAKGLPSAQNFSLAGWNGVSPGGDEPYFSKMVQVGGSPELYINTNDYNHGSYTAADRHAHLWGMVDPPVLDFAQTGIAIEAELKLVSFRNTNGLSVEAQGGPGKEVMFIRFRRDGIELYGLGETPNNGTWSTTMIPASTIVSQFAGLSLDFYYPSVSGGTSPYGPGTHYYAPNRNIAQGIEGGDYYTYRLEYDPEEQKRRFWIDEVLINETDVTTFGTHAAFPRPTRFHFGDGDSNHGVEVYIRSVAFSIPEPTSATLLLAGALAGLLAFGRRKR